MLPLTLCACGTTQKGASGDESARLAIQRTLAGLEEGLRAEMWQSVKPYIARDYPGGTLELRSNLEDMWANTDVLSIRFVLNTVLARDGAYNAQVRWFKKYLDGSGKPKKAEGTAELVLRPAGDHMRVEMIHGESFLE
ncbi:MAG: hypothetical protein ACLFOY_09500 [Desulfatibacillaceae bacterium]